ASWRCRGDHARRRVRRDPRVRAIDSRDRTRRGFHGLLMLPSAAFTTVQQVTLVVLRTLVGWHFLYEGYTKVLQPAWARDGAPLVPWSSAGYLKAATGPLAGVFHALGNASWIGRVV